ncbi:ABC transporter ATP-binding protein [Kineosporia babensis]|uniref:ABC transporter ATP-binding protein n=1 Tax=Kineosporia babensis TaxID=499548 RepID=A0A9X1NJ93_9ACTN|nr:ABC transporter ATP-binding protein [Kineosporia babensis]MCD5314819.1 ABC transporter ATP-binding protein [Kineosporia babensis]
MTEPLLRIQDLTVRAQRRKGPASAVVDGVSFSLNRGETTCVVGESGSGKSVTARAIMGLTRLEPALSVSGEIWFDGKPLHQMDNPSVARLRGRDIAMVFQEPMSSLDPLFTVGSQLTESLRRRHGKLPNQNLRTRLLALLSDVGIPDGERVLRSRPHELSGGMCQRVMIAAALAGEPDLLIADEPTTALDVTVQAGILALLERIRTERGMAVLLVTHDMGVAAEVADQVLVMYSGRIVENASADEVFESPRHPYTAGLLSCVPALEGEKPSVLPTIPGSMPSPEQRPPGCAFHPRCARSADRCSTETPLQTQKPGLEYACWNPIEPTFLPMPTADVPTHTAQAPKEDAR